MKQFLQNSEMVDVSVIIISYNTKDLTLECAKSVINENSVPKKEIIFIDNASSDGSREAIRSFGSKNKNFKIKVIENNKNLGFAKANNQGIRIARGRFILLLNSDAKIKKHTVGELINFAESNKDVGVVGPKLLNSDGSIQDSVFRLPTLRRAVQQYWFGKKGLLDKYFPQENEPVSVESLVMAAFLITPEAIKKVGMLDERYFMYYEDLDYCRRVLRSGLKVYYLPAAEVIHYHGASGKGLADERNQWRRLIPSSKIYHGILKHYLFNFVLWSGQKWQKLLKKQN